MTRHSGDATLLWHGIGETRNCSTTEALAAKPFLWFFGDNAEVGTSRSVSDLLAIILSQPRSRLRLVNKDTCPGSSKICTLLIRFYSLNNLANIFSMQGWYDENLLAEAVVAYPELAALPRAGISYSLWRTLFQNYIVTPSSPTTGWVGESSAVHDTLQYPVVLES